MAWFGEAVIPRKAIRTVRWHLSWRQNGDNLDVGLVANRLLTHGHPAWWCLQPSGDLEAGDYLVEAPPDLGERLLGIGISAARRSGPLPGGARRLAPPRIALLAGRASAYPYFAYYALCLIRLGLAYDPVDGASVAAGALEDANLFVLPGGFAIWGLDQAEGVAGADAAARAFLRGGGACIGSCGGAYYLSAGRPGWTGTAWAQPRYTHEYLQSGTGIVALSLAKTPLGLGCPRTIEVPYYHGPVYEEIGPGLTVAATFRALSLPSRLGIDNRLRARRFADEMAGRPAALYADGRRGRAVLFSPHPEMGDLVRKYIALDGYVRKYLPIRGRQTMEETLLAYRPLESPAFRLVLNAAHILLRTCRGSPWASEAEIAAGRLDPRGPLTHLRRFQRAAIEALRMVRTSGATPYDQVVRTVAADLGRRLGAAAERLADAFRTGDLAAPEEGGRLLCAWNHLAESGTAGLRGVCQAKCPAAEVLMQVELALCLWDAWHRLLAVEQVVRGS